MAPEKKHCARCGNGFYPRVSDQKYCSNACATNQTKLPKGSSTNGNQRKCLYCHKKFVPKAGQGWHCSRTCCDATLAFHAEVYARNKR